MYRMTSYFTGVDFILGHFPAFWQEWLNIFLKLSLQYAIDSIIQLFIKSQAMKTRVEEGLKKHGSNPFRLHLPRAFFYDLNFGLSLN